MSIDAIITVGLFVMVIALLAWGKVDEIIVGVSIPVLLSLFKILDPNVAFNDFANTTVIFFMAVLVLGTAISKTGLADFIGEKVISLVGSTEKRLTLGIGIVASSISGFLNDTGTTGCLMPIVAAMAKKANVKLSKVYMSIAIFASIGGTITLIGTTPHIVASGLLAKAGYQPFGFFEFSKIGIPLTITGLLYMYFFGVDKLPSVESDYDKVPLNSVRNIPGMIITIVVFFAIVFSMATNLLPFHLAAVIGAMVVILTRCITVKDALSSFSMPTLFLVAGIFPLSSALVKTGAAKAIVTYMAGFAVGMHPLISIAIIAAITSILTQFMMNTALTAIMTPIGILLAQSLNLDPRGVVMCIALTASLAFLTPFGTGPNLLVWKSGGYNVQDYFRVGLPMVVLAWMITSVLVYVFYEVIR